MKTGKPNFNLANANINRADEKSSIPVTISKNGNIGGKIRAVNKVSTRLQKLSLVNLTYFGATHYDIHLDMTLGYRISRIFQEMSFSEIETRHRLCELD